MRTVYEIRSPPEKSKAAEIIESTPLEIDAARFSQYRLMAMKMTKYHSDMKDLQKYRDYREGYINGLDLAIDIVKGELLVGEEHILNALNSVRSTIENATPDL